MKKISLFICLFLSATVLFAQKDKKETQTSSTYTPNGTGISYRFFENKKGKNAKVCDYVEFHITTSHGGRVLFDSREANQNEPIQFQLETPAYGSELTHAFLLLSPGDSAEFLVSVDSISKHTGQTSPMFMPGDTLVYRIRMISIKSSVQISKENAAKKKVMVEKDEKLITDYLKSHNLKAVKAPSGIYYVMLKEGQGDSVKTGQNVYVNYSGKTLDDKVFDSSIDPSFGHMEPLSFRVNTGAVISGWDKSMDFLKVGSKAIVFIPSYLAYGESSPTPAIPPNSVLVFEMEIMGVE